MQQTAVDRPVALRRRQVAAGLLALAAVAQLIGQVMLRLPGAHAPAGAGSGPSGMWAAAHVVLVLAVVALLAGGVAITPLIGPGPGTWVGLVSLFVGQSLALAVLAIDLGAASVAVGVIRALDTWDFLAVVGIVILLLELRRRRRDVELGADLALVALAVPPVDGLVVVAAVALVIGFAALAHGLVTGRGQVGRAWLAGFAVATLAVYAVAGAVSWQRAALAVVVLAWTVHHLRTTARRAEPG